MQYFFHWVIMALKKSNNHQAFMKQNYSSHLLAGTIEAHLWSALFTFSSVAQVLKWRYLWAPFALLTSALNQYQVSLDESVVRLMHCWCKLKKRSINELERITSQLRGKRKKNGRMDVLTCRMFD